MGEDSDQTIFQQTGLNLFNSGMARVVREGLVALRGCSQQPFTDRGVGEKSLEGWRNPNGTSAFQKGRVTCLTHQPHLNSQEADGGANPGKHFQAQQG